MTDQVKYTQKLKGAKVLVIGGSSGIGFGVAEALVENGCVVIISSSNPTRVQETIEKLKKSYPSAASNISGHACNLGDEATLESNVEALFEKVGKLDHVVHTAGDSLAQMDLASCTIEKMKKAGMVRFFSPLMVAKHAAKYLTGGPNSSIILTTGAVSERPIPGWSIIGSFATGLQGMTRGLALDMKPIRVNLVSPGAVKTELWNMMSEEQQAEMFKNTAAKVPTGAVGTVEDVTEAYLYLLKDKNITGTMISTNSGALLV